MAQHTIDLPCIADTYCSYDNQATNYGSASLLRSGGYRLTGTGLVVLYYALTKFNTSALPPRKKIIYAGLRVYSAKAMPAAEGAEVAFNLYDINWEESTANYNNQGKTDISYFGQFSGVAFTSGIPSNAWVEIDVTKTPIISAILDGDISDKGIIFHWRDVTPGIPSEDYWQIHSRENTNPPVLRIIYEDVPPDKPTLIGPIGEYKDSNSIIRFEWQYNSSVGGVQKKFDLQWSTDQVNWNTISDETSDTFYDMPAETLPAGNIYWRVQTYNEYDEASGYSDPEVFYSIAAPNYAVIQSISNAARPVIQWQADNQQVFQIQILKDDEVVYDSGDMPGISTRQYRIPVFLDDGEYSARVRIKNEYDMWSEWATYQFTISTTKPGKPVLSVQRSPYGLELTIGNVQGDAYIYRDGIPIAKATGQKYYDNTVANGKEYRYFVRALSANGFADSDTIIGVPAFRFGLLNIGNEVIELKYNLNSVPDKSMNYALVGAMNHYDGRELPVSEMSEFTDINLSLTYFFRRFTKVKKIMEATRKKGVVLYRDKKGLKLYGVITNVTINDVINGYIVSFTIAATDHKEAVEIT